MYLSRTLSASRTSYWFRCAW